MHERVRWVSAQLHVPAANGDFFYYSVKDFGRFDEPDSVEKALSLYFDTMCAGLKVAVQVRDELAGLVTLSPAVAASGRQLIVGGTHLTQVELCASPISGGNPTKWGNGYSISQGELFKGKLNVAGVLRQELQPKVLFLRD